MTVTDDAVRPAPSVTDATTARPHRELTLRTRRPRRWLRSVLLAPLVLGAVFVIALSVVWGRRLQVAEPRIFLGAAPFVGRSFRDGWDWRFGWGLIGAGLVAAAVVAGTVNGWWWRVGLRAVVAASSLGAGLFATLLALTDGADGVRYGAAHRTEYLSNLDIAPPAGEFLRTFVDRIGSYSVHQRGHPPGFVLVLKAFDAIGLGGPWPVAALSVLATVLVAAGVLVAVNATAGDEWVRRVAPMLIVAPYALWMVTSADAVYAAVGAWGVAALAVGVRWRGVRAAAAGAVSGLLLGGLLFLSYGGATFVLVPLAIVVAAARWRRPGTLPVTGAAAVAVAAVVVAFAAAGFWWLAGFAATRTQYWLGSAQFRTWTYFTVSNVAVALIALGPATWAGLTRLPSSRVRVLVIGAALALLAALASGYSRGEVERIWLLFFPWLAIAGGALVAVSMRRRAACWIGAQALLAIVLQAALVSKW